MTRTRARAVLLAGWLAWANCGSAETERGTDRSYWIVTGDGQRIAARGDLEIRPPVVWFRSLNGVLLSVRLDLVDLDATRAANGSASPLAARNIEIATPAIPMVRAPTPAGRVGKVGEAAKRAGKTGTFTDLSGPANPEALPTLAKKPRRAKESG